MLQALGTMIAIAGALRLVAALIVAAPKQRERPGYASIRASRWRWR